MNNNNDKKVANCLLSKRLDFSFDERLSYGTLLGKRDKNGSEKYSLEAVPSVQTLEVNSTQSRLF